MKRWLYNLTTGLMLALCALACVIGVRGRWYGDLLWLDQPTGGGYCITSGRDLIISYTSVSPPGIGDHWGMRYFSQPPARVSPMGWLTPISWNRTATTLQSTHIYTITARSVSFSWWFLITLFASQPAIWFAMRWRQSKTRLTGKCAACNYDLRAHKLSDKCPECGNVIT